ncbi:OmpA family protein [Fodinicurvata halophila]|uniref:OmpA family protein n=1 Tax=Fodinicurvata halophila TaxID=1419723 RepID=A0ABV8UFL9_9PROT
MLRNCVLPGILLALTLLPVQVLAETPVDLRGYCANPEFGERCETAKEADNPRPVRLAVMFEARETRIPEDAANRLDAFAALALQTGQWLSITAHAPNREQEAGGEKVSKDLALERAEALRQAMLDRGVPENHISLAINLLPAGDTRAQRGEIFLQ